MGGRALNSALTGGVIGALSGAGEGETLPGRAAGALTGGAIGTLIGGVASPAVEGVLQVGRAVARPVTQAVRGAFTPETEAARRVVGAVERDIASDPTAVSRLTPNEFRAARGEGQPVTVMDMGGETTRALARSAANTSPEGRAVLGRAIDDRFEGQSDRVTGWMRGAFHYPDAQAQQRAIDTAARNVNTPAYARAVHEGRVGILNDELSELSQAPAMQDAIRAATRQAQNRSAPDVSQGAEAVQARWAANGRPTLEALRMLRN